MTTRRKPTEEDPKPKPPKGVSDYLRSIGSKGGKARGESKVRGDSEYYKKIARKAVAARRKKAREEAAKEATD